MTADNRRPSLPPNTRADRLAVLSRATMRTHRGSSATGGSRAFCVLASATVIALGSLFGIGETMPAHSCTRRSRFFRSMSTQPGLGQSRLCNDRGECRTTPPVFCSPAANPLSACESAIGQRGRFQFLLPISCCPSPATWALTTRWLPSQDRGRADEAREACRPHPRARRPRSGGLQQPQLG